MSYVGFIIYVYFTIFNKLQACYEIIKEQFFKIYALYSY